MGKRWNRIKYILGEIKEQIKRDILNERGE
jgi:hypothetical protein